MPRRTLQPLDRCVNNTRRMLGLLDVHYFSGELVAPSTINTPTPFILTRPFPLISTPLGSSKTFLECVSCEVCEFGAIGEEVLEVSLQRGNTLKPSSFLRCYAT
jgi:hypothetical protein